MPDGSLRMDWQLLTPFLIVGAIWLGVSAGVGAYLTHESQRVTQMLFSLAILWATCLFDLYALARTAGAALDAMSGAREKRRASVLQALYWATIKLACLGILGVVLLRGDAMPAISLYMGSATLFVVPLFGGYWWSQKVLRHA
jgi:hypothetical protein